MDRAEQGEISVVASWPATLDGSITTSVIPGEPVKVTRYSGGDPLRIPRLLMLVFLNTVEARIDEIEGSR